MQNYYDAMFRLHRAALDVYRDLGDERGIVIALTGMGFAERGRGDNARARGWFEESLDLSRRIGDSWRTAASMSNLADALDALGEHEGASAMLRDAVALFREMDNLNRVAWSLNRLGDMARGRGELTEAGQDRSRWRGTGRRRRS